MRASLIAATALLAGAAFGVIVAPKAVLTGHAGHTPVLLTPDSLSDAEWKAFRDESDRLLELEVGRKLEPGEVVIIDGMTYRKSYQGQPKYAAYCPVRKREH